MTTQRTAATTLASPPGHAHASDLEVCTDFINSEEYSDGVPVEHLPTVDDAIAYFTRRGLAHDDALRADAERGGEAWLRRLYAVRAALRTAWDAQVERRAPDATAVAELNRVLDRSPHAVLVAEPSGLGVSHRHTRDDATGEALARVVQPLVEAIDAGAGDRFRVCANHGCRWAFEDSSRGGRRRWCDMSSCGNRAKVRRYRTRRRTVPEPQDTAPAS